MGVMFAEERLQHGERCFPLRDVGEENVTSAHLRIHRHISPTSSSTSSFIACFSIFSRLYSHQKLVTALVLK